jgi:hypothetical protein
MNVCKDCPYRGRCANMGRCIQKRNAVSMELPQPKPVPVLTSNGTIMSGKVKHDNTIIQKAKSAISGKKSRGKN